MILPSFWIQASIRLLIYSMNGFSNLFEYWTKYQLFVVLLHVWLWLCDRINITVLFWLLLCYSNCTHDGNCLDLVLRCTTFTLNLYLKSFIHDNVCHPNFGKANVWSNWYCFRFTKQYKTDNIHVFGMGMGFIPTIVPPYYILNI